MDSSDWCFDNLSESHHQNQVGVIFQSKSGLFELIGQFLRDFTTHIDCKSSNKVVIKKHRSVAISQIRYVSWDRSVWLANW